MAQDADGEDLPVMPGFREMAIRRRKLAADLVEMRRASGLSQTQVAARMGTSQSAVARLEGGDVDVRLSTLERYAAAMGRQVDLRINAGRGAGSGADDRADSRADDRADSRTDSRQRGGSQRRRNR